MSRRKTPFRLLDAQRDAPRDVSENPCNERQTGIKCFYTQSEGQALSFWERDVVRTSSSITDSSCSHLFSGKKRQHTWLANDSVLRTHASPLPSFWGPDGREEGVNALCGKDRQRELEITHKGGTMAKKLYVGNLSYNTHEEDLREAFSKIGEVLSATLIVDQTNGRSKGFGFVEMASDEDAEKAIASMNGTSFMERTITVNEAKPKTDRSGSGGGGRGNRGGYGGGGGGRSWR
jgi:hypothetical protein